MSQCISIGTAHHKDLLKDNLCQELWTLKNKGFNVRVEENPAGGFTFLACSIADIKHAEPVLKAQIANVITNFIVSEWEDKLLRDIIRINYYYFDDAEKGSIYDYAQQKLKVNTHIREKNKLSILGKLTEYLNINSDIIIDGFIRFRLKDYVNELYNVADEAVDDFLGEREYKEFIQLLRYFVEIQEPRVNLVNILLKTDGVFQLYDGEGKAINSEYLQDFLIDLTENEVNYEDLLISELITIAPNEIKFHQGNSEIPVSTFDTISNVFAGRVSKCTGCSLCLSKN